MKKINLDIDIKFDYELIGISSPIKDYKISWLLNKTLGFDFMKTLDFQITSGNKNKKAAAEIFIQKNEKNIPENSKLTGFSQYYFAIEENHTFYFLISNKSEKGTLIPELPSVDYFILIKGPVKKEEIKDCVEKINALPEINTAYKVDLNKLKQQSRQNLIF
ncbi:MAG: IPExxxVDY family protein [Bacteroidales bacterium]|nr:IPExxxVDY family protein [Bacteroidales bacterium]